MKLLDEKGLTTVWAAIKNTFTSKSDADGKYAKKADLADYAKKDDVANSLSFTPNGDSVQLELYNYSSGTIAFESINAADSENAGVMSSQDKNKLDGIDANIGKFNSANDIELCVYGRINFMTPLGDVNLDSILHKEGIIIFANLTIASNITCSEGFLYNNDYIDNSKRVEPGMFLITISADVAVVHSL